MSRKILQPPRKETSCALGSSARTSDSQEGQSPTLFATDRADRRTYIAQGWIVTDPQVLADVGPIPAGEAIIEIPEDVLKLYQRNP